MKNRKIKVSRRHLAKTITWRCVGTLDTILLAYVISGDISSGLQIGLVEIFSKMLLYYFHERVWFNTKAISTKWRHLYKTLSWRALGTLDTIIISWLITGDGSIGLQIGLAETITKMVLYYGHEKLWYRINFGLDKRKKTIIKYFG